ncbi:MAG: hypothetical protein RR617_07910 [Anaerovoracaceae bacterium]
MNYPVHIVAVGGLIENDEGKILMLLSPDRGWEIPGGQVEVANSFTSLFHKLPWGVKFGNFHFLNCSPKETLSLEEFSPQG